MKTIIISAVCALALLALPVTAPAHCGQCGVGGEQDTEEECAKKCGDGADTTCVQECLEKHEQEHAQDDAKAE